MRYALLAPWLVVFSPNAVAAQQSVDLPSCDIPGQRAVAGNVGGKISDPRQAHVSVRANVLTADIGSARKARKLSQADADGLFKRIEAVREQTDEYVKQQGFLSAAERASFDREFDAIAMRICK